MEIKEAQKIVDEWIRSTGKGYFSPLTNMALLTEEVGEVARVISRTYGDQVAKESDKKVKLSEELADALWVIICLANQTGINLEEALMQSLHKKNVRDANRFKY
jgi:NTP pyrophosphatase (non-canonical NTP hydrolase)